MSIPYFPNIPNPPNDPADDVSVMQTNSQSIGQFVTVDHVQFNSSIPPSGQHKQVSFAVNQSAPASGYAGSVLYTNLISSVSELFFKNGRDPNIQLTDLVVNSSTSTDVTMYWIDTPWNIRFLMGLTRIISSGTPLTVTFPNQFSTMYYAGGTPKDPNAHYCSFDYLLNPTPYIVIKTDASVKISFLAVGRL